MHKCVTYCVQTQPLSKIRIQAMSDAHADTMRCVAFAIREKHKVSFIWEKKMSEETKREGEMGKFFNVFPLHSHISTIH